MVRQGKSSSHPKALFQLRRVTRIAALVILAVVIVGFFFPTDYRVERSVSIDAPAQAVMKVLLNGDDLSRWMYIQDGQVISFDGEYTVGSKASISYSKSTKLGALVFTKITHNLVAFDVKPKPKVDVVHNQIQIHYSAGKTTLDWLIQGKLRTGLLSPYFAMFANKIAGSNFEKSLRQLKEIVEVQSK